MNLPYRFCAFLVISLAWVPALFSQDSEIGWANYYSDFFQGKPTAYGEVYDRAQLTCAHKSYGVGTLLRITRMDTQQSVVVRVNDKGPSAEGFLITLSLGGAATIGLDQVGKSRVLVEPVGYAASNPVAAASFEKNTPNAYNNWTAKSANTSNQPTFVSRSPGSAYNPAMPSSNTLLPKSVSPAPASETYVRSGSYTPSDYEYTTENAQYETVPPTTSPQTRPVYAEPVTSQPLEYAYYPPTSTEVMVARTATPAATSTNPNMRFGVQLGAYSNQLNAERQVKAIRQLGLGSVLVVQVNTGTSSLFRIIAGTFNVRAEAEKHQQELAKQFKLAGFVTPF